MNVRKADPIIMVKAKVGISKSELKDELRERCAVFEN